MYTCYHKPRWMVATVYLFPWFCSYMAVHCKSSLNWDILYHLTIFVPSSRGCQGLPPLNNNSSFVFPVKNVKRLRWNKMQIEITGFAAARGRRFQACDFTVKWYPLHTLKSSLLTAVGPKKGTHTHTDACFIMHCVEQSVCEKIQKRGHICNDARWWNQAVWI